MKYVKKPVVVEAMCYTGHNGLQLRTWSCDQVIESPVLEPTKDNPTGDYLQIKTLKGTMTAIPGDWIIKGIKGELYACKPDIFEQTYEKVASFRGDDGPQKVWKAEVVDFSLIPDEFKTLDYVKLGNVVRAGLHSSIPGVRIWEEEEQLRVTPEITTLQKYTMMKRSCA